MAAGGAISYEDLIGKTFTGYFQGCRPNSELGPRAVFVVDRQGNNNLKRLFQQLRELTEIDENSIYRGFTDDKDRYKYVTGFWDLWIWAPMECAQQSVRGQRLEFVITDVDCFEFTDKRQYDIGYNIIVNLKD